jgi:hypothetical protein
VRVKLYLTKSTHLNCSFRSDKVKVALLLIYSTKTRVMRRKFVLALHPWPAFKPAAKIDIQ